MAQFTDSFLRSDGELGSNWDSGYTGFIAAEIASDLIRSTAALGASGSALESLNGALPGADQYAQLKVTVGDTGFATLCGVAARMSSPATATGYFFYMYSSGGGALAHIERNGAGSLGSAAATWVAGDLLTGVARGSVLSIFQNSTRLLGVTEATHATGRIGVYFATAPSYTVRPTGDDFQGGDLPVKTPVAGTVAAAASGNVTPGTPASLALGDLLLCFVHTSDQVSHTMSSDWTQVVQGNGGGTTSRLSVWRARYMGTTPSFLVTHTAGSQIIARACRVSGEPGYMVSVDVAGAITGGTDASIEHAAIVPGSRLSLVLLINGAADDNARTLPAGIGLLFTDISTLGTPDGSLSVMLQDQMAASTGIIAITQAAADPWASVLISLKATPLILSFGSQPLQSSFPSLVSV